MSYNNNLPLASQPINSTTTAINTNFAVINTVFGQDHVPFNDTNPGYHEQITFNDNNVPTAVPSDPTSVIYTDVDDDGHPVPYFGNSTNLLDAGFLVGTPMLLGNAPVVVDDVTGFTIGPIIVNYGIGGSGGGPIAITFALPYTSSSTYVAVVTQIGSVNPATKQVYIVLNTSETVMTVAMQYNTGNIFSYIVIGT